MDFILFLVYKNVVSKCRDKTILLRKEIFTQSTVGREPIHDKQLAHFIKHLQLVIIISIRIVNIRA